LIVGASVVPSIVKNVADIDTHIVHLNQLLKPRRNLNVTSVTNITLTDTFKNPEHINILHKYIGDG
jgi:hypothetical protein